MNYSKDMLSNVDCKWIPKIEPLLLKYNLDWRDRRYEIMRTEGRNLLRSYL